MDYGLGDLCSNLHSAMIITGSPCISQSFSPLSVSQDYSGDKNRKLVGTKLLGFSEE